MTRDQVLFHALLADSAYTGQWPAHAVPQSAAWSGCSTPLQATPAAHERFCPDTGLCAQVFEDLQGPILVFGGTTAGPAKGQDLMARGIDNLALHARQWVSNLQMGVGHSTENLSLAMDLFDQLSRGSANDWRLVGHSKGASEAMAAASLGGVFVTFSGPGLPLNWYQEQPTGQGQQYSVLEDPVAVLGTELPWLVQPAEHHWIPVPDGTPKLSRHNDFARWIKDWADLA